MIQKIILVIMMLVLIPTTLAELAPTKIILTESPTDCEVGDLIIIKGNLVYADGSDINIQHMSAVYVGVYFDGKIRKTGYGIPIKQPCGVGGSFGWAMKITSPGVHKIQIVFDDKPHMNLAGSETAVIYVTSVEQADNNHDVSGLVKFIGYAKGFFALVFFGVLGITIGTGCYSAAIHDPQKRANAQDGLFSLLKILGTVTCVYMAVLFMASV